MLSVDTGKKASPFFQLCLSFPKWSNKDKTFSGPVGWRGLRCTWFKSEDVNKPACPSEAPPALLQPRKEAWWRLRAKPHVCLLPVGPGVSASVSETGLGSGERDLPSLCVRAQFTGADDQHAGGVHPIQGHLRVQAEPGDQVLQVGPRFLPTLEAKYRLIHTLVHTWESICRKLVLV